MRIRKRATVAETERVLRDIAVERERQVAKGWTPKHDDTHHTQTLVRLAFSRTHQGWSTSRGHSRKGLVEAAAILVAAVEAMDRAASTPPRCACSDEECLDVGGLGCYFGTVDSTCPPGASQ